jgi:transcriptional regulator with XRE-family HTH domain
VEWSDTSVEFGKKLKELRKQAGLTQQQLGERVGVTKSVISFYELQERSPSPDVLVKLSRIFHVSTDYLLGIEKEKTLDVSGLDEDDIKVVKLMIDTLRRKNSRKSK